MVRLPPPPPDDPPSPSSLLPPHAASASAAAVMPAVATSARRPLLDTEYIRYLVLMGDGRGRSERTTAAACGHWEPMTNTPFPRCGTRRRGRDRVVTTAGGRCDAACSEATAPTVPAPAAGPAEAAATAAMPTVPAAVAAAEAATTEAATAEAPAPEPTAAAGATEQDAAEHQAAEV